MNDVVDNVLLVYLHGVPVSRGDCDIIIVTPRGFDNNSSMNIPTTILASTSPRRRLMLREVIPNILFGDVPLFEEIIPPRGNVALVAQDMALKKLHAVLSGPLEKHIQYVITADTLVAHQDVILGKPRDINEARQMLLGHLGQTHTVISAAWLFDRQAGTEHPLIETASVRFRPNSDEADKVINAYLKLTPPEGPLDKAGGYGIQEPPIWENLIAAVEGPYEAVVGFPLRSFQALWRDMMS